MRTRSRKSKKIEVQPTVSSVNHPSRFGAAFFVLIFITLTASTTVLAQRPAPAPQRPVVPARSVQLPDALRNRVVVARPIIGKGFPSIPTTANRQARLQLLTPAQRSQIIQTAKSG